MLNISYYNDSIRKYTALIGTLFNNIIIEKIDGSTTQNIKVPINYSPKSKLFERPRADPNLDRPFKIQVPRMGYELSGMEYDPTRKLTTTIKLKGATSGSGTVYMPVPWNLTYELNILVKTQSDGTRIVEQILPFFTPDWTPTVELIPELGLKYDIPILLDSVSLDDGYEGSFDDDRMIVWTLRFIVKGWLFGPVDLLGGGKVIKFANVNFYTSLDANTPVERVTVQPGLTANGEPTSNISLTIPYSQIESDDNYGYIVRIVDL